MRNAFGTPKTTQCPLYGPQDKNVPGSSTVGWGDGAWVQVRDCFCCWWRHLLTGSDAAMFPRHVVLVGLNRPFRIEDSLPSRPPSWIPRAFLPPKWSWCPRVTLLAAANRAVFIWPAHAHTFVAALLVCARPSAAVPQVAPRARASLLLSASRVHVWPCLVAVFSCPRTALPYYATGSNASRSVAAAFSARLQARCWLFPRPGLVWHLRPAVAPPSSCASTPADSTASASVFTAMLASTRGSGSSRPSLRACPHGAGSRGGSRSHNENARGNCHRPYLLRFTVCNRMSPKSHRDFEQAFVNGHW